MQARPRESNEWKQIDAGVAAAALQEEMRKLKEEHERALAEERWKQEEAHERALAEERQKREEAEATAASAVEEQRKMQAQIMSTQAELAEARIWHHSVAHGRVVSMWLCWGADQASSFCLLVCPCAGSPVWPLRAHA